MVRVDNETVSEVLKEVRYEMALANGDSGIIELLDHWLSQWLYRKNQCPVCGGDCDG